MLKAKLKEIIAEALEVAFPGAINPDDILIEYPADPTHGDYACNVALRLSKQVGRPPRAVAETIVEQLGKPDFAQAIEIAGPGFINFFITPDHLTENVRTILRSAEDYGKNRSGEGKKVMIEYSSPNTNKPLHLGHARNNFLGMAVARVLEANGFNVTKTQIINDRGIHICKSMAAYERFGRNTSPESVDKKGDHFVGDYYVKFSKEESADPSLEERARELLRLWESGDPEVRALWEKLNSWVFDGFNRTYERIGSHFEEVSFESEISEGGRAIVENALKEGKAERIEGGAIAIDLSDVGLGDSETGRKVLVRSDGTTIYMTQDLQLAVNRMEGTGLDQLIYVVGREQDYHFNVLFEVLKRFGYKWADRCHHLSYGMVNLPSGKMKSREGTSVDIDTLLDELEALVHNEITERNMPYEGEELAHLIQNIALGALKYFILKIDSQSEMLYNPTESIDFQGNTGPYLQYTHARIHSILRKSGQQDTLAGEPVDPEFLQEPDVLAILRKLQLYPEVVHTAAHDLRVHHLATYLSELAQLTNSFYTQYPVLEGSSDPLRLARLQLIAAVARVLKNGLTLLGIHAPARM